MSGTGGFPEYVHYWEQLQEPSAGDSSAAEPSVRVTVQRVKMIVVGDAVVAATKEHVDSRVYSRKSLPDLESRYLDDASHATGQDAIRRRKFAKMISRVRSTTNDDRHVIPFVFCVHRFERLDESAARVLLEVDAVQKVPESRASVDGSCWICSKCTPKF